MDDIFEVFQGEDTQWYFHRKAGNGEIVAESEGYTTRDSAVTEASREAGDMEVRVLDGPDPDEVMTDA